MHYMKQEIFILIFFLFILGCKKKSDNYSKKYLGRYSFTLNQLTYLPITGAKDTVYYFTDNITKGSEINSIIISTPLYPLQALVYEEGTIEGYNNNGKGEFESNEKFIYKWQSMSAGSSAYYQLKGVKK